MKTKIDTRQGANAAGQPQVAPSQAPDPRPKPEERAAASSGAASAPVSAFGDGVGRVERRTKLRHKISATGELTEVASGKHVKAPVTSVSRDGCYVKLEDPLPVGTVLKLSIIKDNQSFKAQARVSYTVPGQGLGLAFTTVEPQQREILESWLAANLETSWLASSRRRSHRIMLKVPVTIAGNNGRGVKFTEETSTESVSAYGALLLLSTEVARGQLLTVTNLRTKAALECSVVYIGQSYGKLREVGVSFTRPNRMFWQVSFPPSDWTSRHPDARGS